MPYPASFPQQTTAAAAFVATIEDRRALEAYRVEERQLAAAAEASMREVSDADDADDADDDEDDERSRSRLTSPDSRPPEDVERLVAGLSAQLEDARDALEIAENELTCQICFEERRDAVLMPCMHMLYCVGVRGSGRDGGDALGGSRIGARVAGRACAGCCGVRRPRGGGVNGSSAAVTTMKT